MSQTICSLCRGDHTYEEHMNAERDMLQLSMDRHPAGRKLDTSKPEWPRLADEVDRIADADHRATGEDDCDKCGLAVTGDGRHGLTALPDEEAEVQVTNAPAAPSQLWPYPKGYPTRTHTEHCYTKTRALGIGCTCLNGEDESPSPVIDHAWATIPRDGGITVPGMPPAARRGPSRRSLDRAADIVAFVCYSAFVLAFIAVVAAWFLDWKMP